MTTTTLLRSVFALTVVIAGASYLQAQKPKPSPKSSVQKAPTQVKATNKTSTDAPLNPALSLLSVPEKQLLDEINYARGNPGEYIKVLESFRKHYRGKEIHYPEGGVLVTNEGVEALDDAIEFLRKVKPLLPLDLSSGMVQAAKVHVNDLVSTGKSGHRGSDGSQPGERLDRFGRWDDSYGENIVYESRTPRYDVIGMIIDDGTSNRGHRENLFAEEFRVIGIAMGTRPKGPSLRVVTFAGGFSEKR